MRACTSPTTRCAATSSRSALHYLRAPAVHVNGGGALHHWSLPVRLARLPSRWMGGLPRRDLLGELDIVLGERAQLAQHLVLGGAAGARHHGSRGEELARRVDAPFHLQHAVHGALGVHFQGDEHDHSPRKGAAEGEEVRSHAGQDGPGCRVAQTVRPESPHTRGALTSSLRILSTHFMTKNVLVVDIGGSHIKARASGRRTEIKADSGPDLTPRQMVDRVLDATEGWQYDVVSIGYPGPVVNGRITREPVNLGRGWTRFDFGRAFGCPVRVINDAAMQAIGSYR